MDKKQKENENCLYVVKCKGGFAAPLYNRTSETLNGAVAYNNRLHAIEVAKRRLEGEVYELVLGSKVAFERTCKAKTEAELMKEELKNIDEDLTLEKLKLKKPAPPKPVKPHEIKKTKPIMEAKKKQTAEKQKEPPKKKVAQKATPKVEEKPTKKAPIKLAARIKAVTVKKAAKRKGA